MKLNSNGQLRFNKNELDGLDTPEKYPDNFGVLLCLSYKNVESSLAAEEPWFKRADFEAQIAKTQPHILFNSAEEMQHIMQTFGTNL